MSIQGCPWWTPILAGFRPASRRGSAAMQSAPVWLPRRPPRSGKPSRARSAEALPQSPSESGFTSGADGSVGVFVLAPGPDLLRGLLGGPLHEERVVRRDERVGRHHRVGVVDGPVLASEGVPARPLAQTVLELGAGLLRPLDHPLGRVIDHLLDLGYLLSLLLG